MKTIKEILQAFLILWGVIIVLNQVFIFGACFAPYCIIAALPHTAFIAGIIIYLANKGEVKSKTTRN